MIVYIVVVVALIIASVLLLRLPHLEFFRENEKSFNFILSLLSTFIGFFIALSINTYISESDRKANLVKVLKAANLSLENSEMKIQGMYLNRATAGEDVSEIVKYAPLEVPKIYYSLETNTLVNDYFSSNAFQAYILCSDNMQTFLKKINSDNLDTDSRVKLLQDYLKYLKVAKRINNIELDLLQNKVNESDETAQLQKISNSLNMN